MKKFNKTIALLLVLVMCMMLMPLTAMAATNTIGVTFSATLDKATIDTGAEAQQVVMTVKANKEFETDGMGLKVLIPEGWTLAAIENADLQIPAGEINLAEGLVSYSTPDAENWSTELIVKVTYNVPANVAAGTYTLGIQNLTLSKDFGTEWESDGSASVTLTVNGASQPEPAIAYSATLDKAAIDTGAEAQQVVMTVKANKEFETDGMGLKVLIPEGWTLAAIENADLQIPAGEINLAEGLVSYSTPDAENWSTDLIVKVTYNVPANVAAGTYTLGIQNLTLSKDFGTEWESDGSASVTLTVNGAAHTCQHDHYDTTETTHQSVCACGQTIGEATDHTGGTATCNAKAKCATCGAEYGNVDKTNHVGETEIRNASAASCNEPGYTGDTYCKSCDTMIQKGQDIPATGNHVDADSKWESNENGHFHTCGCGAQFDQNAHTGGTATCNAKAKCETCGAEYGDVDKTNHVGETEIRNASAASCNEPGYTGDTYCKSCDTMIQKGQDIPATGEHVDADGMWEADGNAHFHTCGCGTVIDRADHTGGTATCVAKAQCEICKVEYGDVNKENHTGEYVTHNVVEETCGAPGYTGDLHCKDCDTLLEKGEEIPATGSHTGGTATCVDKAVCGVCGQSYGEVDYKNHVGEEKLVDASEPTCVTDGYTGDIWCLSCNEMKVRGQILPATGEHAGTYRFTWQWDAEQTELTLVVWFHCATCQSDVAFENVTDIGEVTKVATCSETGVRTYTFDMSNAKLPEKCTWDDFTLFNNDLGDENAVWNYETKTMTLSITVPVDPNNHVGEEKLVDKSEPTCVEEGYTGDIWCLSCNEMKVRGQILPATGKHAGTYRFTWDWDANHNECTLVVWFHCNTCNNDIAFKNANDAGVVTKVATCKETGIRTYTFDLSGAELPGNCTWDNFVLLNNDLGDKDAAWNYQAKVMTLNVVLPIDPNNHVGETEIRGAVKETCGDPGYTGDTHCKDCGAKIAEGKRIEPTGDHKGGTATCMACAVCEVCGQSYGELDPKNHAGDIIQKELVTKEPTCSEPGKKTVTDFCSKCMTPVNEKEVEIPATGEHTGGEATCTKKAVCEVCGKEYGEKDRDNHNWNEKWYQDEKVHWHECDDCHEGKDMNEHYDNDGDKKCDDCGYIFGSVPNTGETPVILISAVVMLIAACGAVLVFKKRRTVC